VTGVWCSNYGFASDFTCLRVLRKISTNDEDCCLFVQLVKILHIMLSQVTDIPYRLLYTTNLHKNSKEALLKQHNDEYAYVQTAFPKGLS